MSFLTAEWRKLALANYEVEPSILREFLPAKTELDIWNGRCYVSLVGFMFKNVKLLGLSIPFHTDFEEVNLRFYVKHKSGDDWKRGVVFVKEIVPKAALTFVANTIYREHYETLAMRHVWNSEGELQEVKYDWKKQGRWHSFQVETEKESRLIPADSETEFITQHFWGYTKINEKKTFEYEVTHPKWEAYEVKRHKIDVDFGMVYGERFRFLNEAEPTSVMLAEGSKITVENKRKL